MTDFISRQALRDAMYHEAFETDSDMQRWDSGCWIRYKMFENAIEAAPTIDPVKHGKWLIRDNPGTGWYRVTCSECGEDVTSVAPVIGFFPNAKVIWQFCPDCGAKMEDSKNEAD